MLVPYMFDLLSAVPSVVKLDLFRMCVYVCWVNAHCQHKHANYMLSQKKTTHNNQLSDIMLNVMLQNFKTYEQA